MEIGQQRTFSIVEVGRSKSGMLVFAITTIPWLFSLLKFIIVNIVQFVICVVQVMTIHQYELV